MRILAIDYGKRKIGIAFSESKIAEPLFVLRYENERQIIKKISEIVKKREIEEIVVGLSEGLIAKATRKFAMKLEEAVSFPIIFSDETLSTHDAQAKAIEAGIKRTKRKKLEDAYAAAVILQTYLDSLNH